MKRHRVALIIDSGAVNPLPISKALYEAVLEAREENPDTDSIWADAAVCLILNQMMCMAQCSAGVTLERYGAAVFECQQRAE